MMNSLSDKLDKLIFLSLCGYALASCISLELSNGFIVLMSIIGIIRMINKPPRIDAPKKYLIPIFVFFLTLFLLMFLSDDLLAAVRRYWRFASRLIPFIITIAFIKERRQIATLAIAVVISLTIENIYAIWQGFYGDFRAAGFRKDPNDLAGFLVQWLPILFVLSIDKLVVNQRKYVITALIIGSIALLFNGTRGAWITLVMLLPVLAIMYQDNSKKVIGCIIVAMFILGMMVYSIPGLNARMATLTDRSYQSNTERILMWNSAIKMFCDYPITGIGLGTYAHKYQEEYISPLAKDPKQGHAHNNFLQMLAETGIIGFSSFVYMFGAFIYYSFKDWKQLREPTSLMFFAATCGLMLQGLTEVNFGNRVVMTLYHFTMALYLQYRYSNYSGNN